MQSVEKRAHPVGNKSRLLWLITALLLIIAACVTAWLLNRPTDPTPLPRADASTFLYDHPASAVASVTIHRGSEDAWTAVPVPHTSMTILGDEGLTLTWDESEAFLSAAAHIAVEEVLTEDDSVYIGHLADYGLEQPRYEARIVYADGTDFVLSVGDKGPDGTWRYMIISGDERLFAFSFGEGNAVNTGLV